MASKEFNFLNFSNAKEIESLFQKYKEDPESVDLSWRYFFEGMGFASQLAPSAHPAGSSEILELYRKYGHLAAKIDPIGIDQRPFPKQLLFSKEALQATGKEVEEKLKSIYCGSIGYECEIPEHPEIENWIYEQIEHPSLHQFSKENKKNFFLYLYKADAFENFIHKRYQGKKRFSLEGNDALIPCMLDMLDLGSRMGLKECLIAMAHRGRLNTLTHVMGKDYTHMFHEFEKSYRPPLLERRGDINYHKGYESDYKGVHLSLLPNPSHLESINPVLEGFARARQEKTDDPSSILPIVMHGDGALSGQGIVYETMQLCRLDGYEVKGTLHIVINNQIGYTAEKQEGRSTTYCTDVAKAFSAPVFHVNAEDVEAAAFVFRLALAIRQKFQIDVFIDLVGYRKYGHNEADEPAFTNPKIYRVIREKQPPFVLYREKLIKEGVITQEEIEQLQKQVQEEFENAFAEAKNIKNEADHKPAAKDMQIVSTSVKEEQLVSSLQAISQIPEGFDLHRKIRKIIEERQALAGNFSLENEIDWALAEHLAYATLLMEGFDIRVSGQDTIRGTFAHRHGALYDQKTQNRHFPLKNVKGEGKFSIYNSCLSEYGVLGFEYGYSVASPKALTIWEAQYGDFANGAQIIIDQYVSSGEAKWGQGCPLAIFLPHGAEGAGPEHTSARIERYLDLCADDNMRVVYPSTPAQWFHLLRLIKHGKESLPHIIFTPKSMLRFKPSFSLMKELTQGSFQPVIDDQGQNYEATKILFTSAKTYYELQRKKEEFDTKHIAMIRIEQYYPFPHQEIDAILSKYKKATEFAWVQEEHKNMGAYRFLAPLLANHLPNNSRLLYVGREESASPATGAMFIYNGELERLINEAFKGKDH